jgi:hypothetical protein
MKKIALLFIALILTICSYSQEYIKFNGATFGKPLNEFIKGFPGSPTKYNDGFPKGFNSSLCNHYCYLVRFNSRNWKCHIFTSKTTDTVFRTVSVESYTDLKNNLMLLVKALEEKYGGGVQEKQENLGEVVYGSKYYKEMLALYYYIKGKNNKRIGEIRISAAPWDENATWGVIELSYTDYNSRDKATREYNSLMRDAL